MATKCVTVCDRCNAEKKNANHWFRAGVVDGALIILPSNKIPPVTLPAAIDLCGEECVIKETQDYLTKTKVIPARQTAKAIMP